MTKRETSRLPATVCDCARFTLLADGLVRLEYAPDGRFEDRPTFRAIGLPSGRPFDAVSLEAGEHVLASDSVEIRYRPTGAFDRDNLTIRWAAGDARGSWSPGARDDLNLGGITTLDQIDRALLPEGVHPAPMDAAARLDERNLAEPILRVLEAVKRNPAIDPRGELTFDTVADRTGSLPDHLRALFDVWRKAPPGPISRAGYWVLDETGQAFYDAESGWLVRNHRADYQNLFFMWYGHDYARALRLFTLLCGQVPLLPRWALGPWFSCYDQLSGADNRAIVAEFEQHGLPLDVLVLDMDWHKHGWDGWDWNEATYPDPDDFFEWKRRAGLKVTMNLHCDTIRRGDTHFSAICRKLTQSEDVADPAEPHLVKGDDSWALDYTDPTVWEAVREVCLRPNERRGVDFWWLDNWQGCQPGYNSVLWINHLFWRAMEQRGQRPMLLGRYAGIGSHRYGAYFSGDTCSHWEILRHELEVNIRAGHVGLAYLSHDLGGFKGAYSGQRLPLIDPELYVRWLQMGALSPIMRLHSDHGRREPWAYGDRVLQLAREAFRLHAELVPYFYHLLRAAHDTGLPPHRPLHFLFPRDERAYQITDQYFLGDRMLLAPVVTAGGRRRVYFPAGEFHAFRTHERITGPTTLERVFGLDEIPIFVRAGSIIPVQPVSQRVGTQLPDPLVLAVYPGGADALELYEDDGETPAYREGAFSRWPISLTDDGRTLELLIEPIHGGFAGMPQHRSLRVEVRGFSRPSRVQLDGQCEETSWRYDEDRQQLLIVLTNAATRASNHVVVAR